MQLSQFEEGLVKDLVSELDRFFTKYGEVTGPGAAIIGSYRATYQLGVNGLNLNLAAERMPHYLLVKRRYAGPVTVESCYDWFLAYLYEAMDFCRVPFSVGDVYISPSFKVSGKGDPYAQIEVFAPFYGRHWFDIDDEVGIRLVCEHLMGQETPLLDWLMDNCPDLRRMVEFRLPLQLD